MSRYNWSGALVCGRIYTSWSALPCNLNKPSYNCGYPAAAGTLPQLYKDTF